MSKYCSNCGAQISKESIFCSGCGNKIKEDKEQTINCSNCDFQNKSSEKYCSNCGTNLHEHTKKNQVKGSVLKNKKTSIPSNRKKKNGCLKTLLLIVLGFLAIVIVGSIILYNLGNTPDSKVRVDTDLEVNRDKKDNSNNTSKTTTISVYYEPASLKKASLKMETIFMEADTTQLKLLLTDTSFKTYTGVYAEIEPYMTEYGKAFKNRKLLKMNDIIALYAFEDEEGNKYTAEFTSVNKHEWKLVRF
jgi:DNA-directed RNA polymerase subunit RPC12/RpoP